MEIENSTYCGNTKYSGVRRGRGSSSNAEYLKREKILRISVIRNIMQIYGNRPETEILREYYVLLQYVVFR